MKIKKLIATDVNGILNFNLKFDENLSFLIGINGSGKTTALKLLLGLITPSFSYLSNIAFKSATLECVGENDNEIKIIAQKKKEELFELELLINGISKAKNKVPIVAQKKYVDEDEEMMMNRKFNQFKVVIAIRDLKTPIFLGLDRRIIHRKPNVRSRRQLERRLYNQRLSKRFSLSDPMNSSIFEIQELINEYVLEIAEKQPQLTEEFKTELLNNSISYFDEGELNFNLEAINEKRLSLKRESLEKAVKNLAIGDFKERIDDFFERFTQLNNQIREYTTKKKDKKEKDIAYLSKLVSQMMINSSQLNRIDSIIELSQSYQKKITALREPINRLNGILSKFFSDNKKGIEVQPNGEFIVTLLNGDIASPFELSSGEKQILIMITHLIFYEDRTSPGIFIIDEPELSLHLGWQEIFVDSIKEASPETQFILATHSPTIIGGLENDKYCIDVNSGE